MSKSKHKNKKIIREAMSKYMNYEPDFGIDIKVGDMVKFNIKNILERKDKFNEKYIEFVQEHADTLFVVTKDINNAHVYELDNCIWTFHYTDLIKVEEKENGIK